MRILLLFLSTPLNKSACRFNLESDQRLTAKVRNVVASGFLVFGGVGGRGAARPRQEDGLRLPHSRLPFSAQLRFESSLRPALKFVQELCLAL